MWIGFSGTYYIGGQATVDGERSGTAFKNGRYGVTFSLPLERRHSLKFSYGNGAFVRQGTDFQTFTIGYQFIWLGL